MLHIAAGIEARKMIVAYDQIDGTVKVFGYQMPDGPISAATGSLKHGWHHKCFHVARKREARMGAGHTAPDDPIALERLHAELRQVAARIGKPVGDPEVAEAHRAAAHGGPYAHGHEFPLDDYQLVAHLRHAHGWDGAGNARGIHADAHLRPSRDDPDWRHHVVAEI